MSAGCGGPTLIASQFIGCTRSFELKVAEE